MDHPGHQLGHQLVDRAGGARIGQIEAQTATVECCAVAAASDQAAAAHFTRHGERKPTESNLERSAPVEPERVQMNDGGSVDTDVDQGDSRARKCGCGGGLDRHPQDAAPHSLGRLDDGRDCNLSQVSPLNDRAVYPRSQGGCGLRSRSVRYFSGIC
jgi:hypothetical protein